MKIKNDPSKDQWFFADTKQMAEISGSTEILVELVSHSHINKKYSGKYFPLSRDPKIDLVNNHLGYALTWFGLTAFTFIGLLRNKKVILR
jgi:surfeit locus 1 family protein